MIVLSYTGACEMADVFQRALKPGWIIVIEAFHRDAKKDRSIGAGVVFETGQLSALYPQLRGCGTKSQWESAISGWRKCGCRHTAGNGPN